MTTEYHPQPRLHPDGQEPATYATLPTETLGQIYKDTLAVSDDPHRDALALTNVNARSYHTLRRFQNLRLLLSEHESPEWTTNRSYVLLNHSVAPEVRDLAVATLNATTRIEFINTPDVCEVLTRFVARRDATLKVWRVEIVRCHENLRNLLRLVDSVVKKSSPETGLFQLVWTDSNPLPIYSQDPTFLRVVSASFSTDVPETAFTIYTRMAPSLRYLRITSFQYEEQHNLLPFQFFSFPSPIHYPCFDRLTTLDLVAVRLLPITPSQQLQLPQQLLSLTLYHVSIHRTVTLANPPSRLINFHFRGNPSAPLPTIFNQILLASVGTLRHVGLIASVGPPINPPFFNITSLGSILPRLHTSTITTLAIFYHPVLEQPLLNSLPRSLLTLVIDCNLRIYAQNVATTAEQRVSQVGHFLRDCAEQVRGLKWTELRMPQFKVCRDFNQYPLTLQAIRQVAEAVQNELDAIRVQIESIRPGFLHFHHSDFVSLFPNLHPNDGMPEEDDDELWQIWLDGHVRPEEEIQTRGEVNWARNREGSIDAHPAQTLINSKIYTPVPLMIDDAIDDEVWERVKNELRANL